MLTAAIYLGVVLSVQPSYSFRWEPQKGETHVYEFFLTGKDASVEASLEHSVVKVGKDGSYTVRSRSLGAIVRISGQEIRDDRPNKSSATYDSLGRLDEITGGTGGLGKYRNALLTSFVAPPNAGDVGMKWTYERPKDQPRGLPACKIEYRFVANTNPNLLQVDFTYAELGGEHPQTATGTWWIGTSKKNPWLPVKMEAKVTNFAGSESGESDVRLELRKSE